VSSLLLCRCHCHGHCHVIFVVFIFIVVIVVFFISSSSSSLSLSVFVVVVFVDIVVDFYRINLSKTKEKEKEKTNKKKTRGVVAPPCCCLCCPCRLPSVSSHWSLVIIVFRWPALLLVIILLVSIHCCSVGPIGSVLSFLFRCHYLAVVGLGWAVLHHGGGAYVEYGPKKKKKCN
jgi:hypothetical protein